ncbi:MAG: HYR domain-containing protein [Acidobacteriia bacterium]|nr:HYR domain-containing protein [Terriglobia bacterium]
MLRPIAQHISRRMKYWIATSLFVLALSGFLATPASAQQVISTFSKGAPGDPLLGPTNLVFDKSGNLFVSDNGNHRVQRIDQQTRAVTTIAGTGTAGYAGDGGPATQAQLSCPSGLAFDPSGNLYIAEPCQNVVRKVVPGADLVVTGAGDEIITTFAGNGTRDACNWTNGVPANQTSVDSPYDVAVDQGGNVFILESDCFDIIRRVDAATGLISTTLYQVTTSGFNSMVFDNLGNLLVSVFSDIDLCPPATGQFLTGTEGCVQALSTSSSPHPKAFDKAGNLFFLDYPCDADSVCDLVIYQATPGPDGIIEFGSQVSPYAGNGNIGYSGDGGPPLAASFSGPSGMALDDAGNLFIADTGNNVIRMVSSGPATPALTSHPANPTNQTTAVFSFADNDPTVISFVCTLDQAPSPCASGVTYPNLSDGSHTFSVVGKQADGTPSNPTSFTWVVDTVPPPVPSIDSHPSDPSGTATATFTFSDAEAGTSLTCGLDGSVAFCSSPVVYAGLSDGAHTFSVIASDAAGNHSANSFTWTIRTTIPPAPHIDSAPPALWNQNVAAFSFSDAQAGLNFLCQLDALGFSPCASPVTYGGLPDGPHSFSVIVSDPVSGRSSAAATYSWTVDTTPPRVGITGALGRVVIPAPSTFYFSGGSADIAGYLCSVDGAAFSPCTRPFTQLVTTPGNHTFSVEAVDFAGNIGPAASTTWLVTFCNCGLVGDYSSPAFAPTITSQDPNGVFTVSAINNGNQVTVSLVRTSDAAVVYSFVVPITDAGWQFSPDGNRFAYQILNIATGQDDVTVLDLTASTPKQILQFSVTTGSSALMFSPSGAYLLYAATVPFATKTSISIYRVAGVSTAVLVQSASFTHFAGLGALGENSVGVGAWGFNKNPYGEPEAAFFYAWSTSDTTFSWSVVNLATGKQVISQSSTAQAAFWQFNPCGNIIAFVNQPFSNEEQVDLFSTQDGTHIGETSFPVQEVTLNSTPDQEVANIVNPQQTIVIANDPTCAPNTPSGSNVSVAPVCPGSNTSPATVTFSNVTQAGGTGVSSSATGNAAPAGFQIGNPPVYYDIATSASYSGTVGVCLDYSGVSFNGPPRLFHFVNGAWVDVTTSVDTVHHIICGSVSSLSPFAIFASTNLPPSVQAGPPQVIEATSPLGALVTLNGSGSDPDNDPLTFTWSESGVTLGTGTPISITLPIGVHTITFAADDGRGGTGTSTVLVTVQDTTPPVLTMPANQTLEATGPAGAMAVFSASSTDLVDGARPVVCSPASGSTFPLGATLVNCTATDLHGNSAQGSFLVTVRDTTPPVLHVTLSPQILWPPNKKLIPITAKIQVNDLCDPNPTVTLVSISSNDPDDDPIDIQGAVLGTDDRTFLLRARRADKGASRVYTVTYRALDHSGNATTATAIVSVPQDRDEKRDDD